MNILVPIAITPGMLLAGTTIPEPAPGETAWVSGGNYVIDDVRVNSGTLWSCVLAHSARAALPATDAKYWERKGPSNRMAPFDTYISTPATATGALTYVLQPGFFNAISLYGLEGATYTLSIKDAPGGTDLMPPKSGYLYEEALGFYELLFLPLRPLKKLVFINLPISPVGVLTLTIAADAGAPVGLGMLNAGDYRPLFGWGEWGGTEDGAEAEPISYSYIKTYDDGTTEIKRRSATTGLTATVSMPRDWADYAVACIQDVLDIPVSCIATDQPGYNGLNVFGLLSGRVKYTNYTTASADIKVKGSI